MLDALKTIHKTITNRRKQRQFDNALALIRSYGFSVVQLEKVAGTTYVVDQQTGARIKVGKRK